MEITPKLILDYIRDRKISSIYLTSHINCDPDGFCSTSALASFIKRNSSDTEVKMYFDSLGILSQHIATKFNLSYNKIPEKDPDLWIILDTGYASQLGSLQSVVSNHPQKIVFDHHSTKDETFTNHKLSICTPAPSTAEVIYSNLFDPSHPFSSEEATLLLTAIVFDTRRFLLGTSSTLTIVNNLVALGANYSLAISLLNKEMTLPERIARLKGAQRLTIHRHKGWLFTLSHVSAYEASVARAMINLGADVALGLAENTNSVRISARSTTRFYKQTQINLVKDVLVQISELINGTVGGHPTAAGANGTQNGTEALKTIIDILKNKITIPRENNP